MFFFFIEKHPNNVDEKIFYFNDDAAKIAFFSFSYTLRDLDLQTKTVSFFN